MICGKGSADTQHTPPYKTPSSNAEVGKLRTVFSRLLYSLYSDAKLIPALRCRTQAMEGRSEAEPHWPVDLQLLAAFSQSTRSCAYQCPVSSSELRQKVENFQLGVDGSAETWSITPTKQGKNQPQHCIIQQQLFPRSLLKVL